MEETQRVLRSLRADATYEKKKHYHAAQRKRRLSVSVNIGLTGITLLAMSSFLYSAFGSWTRVLALLSGGLSLVSAFLSFLQLFADYGRVSTAHLAAADRFLSIAKECTLQMGLYADGQLSREELSKVAVELRSRYDESITSARGVPTNSGDYRAARKGLISSEENYSDVDMSIGDGPRDG